MIIIKKIQQRQLNTLLLVSFLLLLSSIFNMVSAASETAYKSRPLDVRVDRLERLMSSQKQLELLYRMKQLQEENQQLRGLLEEQANEIRQIKQQQRQLYTDLERRFSASVNTTADNTTPAGSTVPASAEVNISPPAADVVQQPQPAVPVVDKSGFAEAKYGVTEREEVLPTPAMARQKDKPPVYKKQSMTAKQRKDEQKLYQQAYDELRARRYSKARDSFIALIKKYPGGRYAHIAQYWVAESSYAQNNYAQAIIDYQLLLDVYPGSPKKAEAELKKAYSYYELGNKESARQTLNQLLINYPDTTEAGQARRLLKQL